MIRTRRAPPAHTALAFAIALLCASGASAQSVFATDISLELDGLLTTPRDVVTSQGGGAFSAVLAGSLPEGASIAGYHRDTNGDVLYVSRVAIELPGALLARRQDVVRNAGGVETIELDGLAAGIPESVGIDALSMAGSELLLSFDQTVELGGTTFADEDVVQRSGSSWIPFFDGSAHGVAADLDVDGSHYDSGNDVLYLSFDQSGVVGGVPFDDEDVVAFDRGAGTWSMAFDATAADPALASADVTAVPEPGFQLGLLAGIGGLVALFRLRLRPRPQH